MNRLFNIIKLTLVLGLSLLLLNFVGQGEARRTYPQFMVEKMAAQADLARGGIEVFLRSDFPLKQFPGFATLTQPILDSDSDIFGMYITDADGEMVVANVNPKVELGETSLDLEAQDVLAPFVLSIFQPEDVDYVVRENPEFYQVSFNLESRFETVGQLHIFISKAAVQADIDDAFLVARVATAAVLGLYMVFLLLTSRYWMTKDEGESGWTKRGTQLLAVSYGVSFLVVAVIVSVSLLNLYISGIESRTRALTNSLAQRLKVALDFGLTLEDFNDLDVLFTEYKDANPDLSFVSLTVDRQVAVSTNPTQIGASFEARGDEFEYQADLGEIVMDDGSGQATLHILHLGVPKDVVYQRLWRSAKNFLALFIASAFLTQIFFSLIRSQSNQPKLTPGTLHTRRGYLLSLIGPAYFFVIFVTNGLTVSFLPQYFAQISSQIGRPISISALFSVYFLFYAIALPIAGGWVEKRGPRPLMITGALMVLAALLVLIFVPHYYMNIVLPAFGIDFPLTTLFLVQAITGFGEGLYFIAVQAYILKVATKDQRTRGAGMLVNSLYGGLLAGMAIGALLVVDPVVAERGVFAIAALFTVFVLFYVMFMIPDLAGEDFSESEGPELAEQPEALPELEVIEEIPGVQPAGSRWDTLLKALTDPEFIKTALLIGIPVKIVWTGLFKASFPLVLTKQDYPVDDIGQIMMLYTGGVLLMSAVISRITDRVGKTRPILFIGAIGSGIGLIMIGLMGWEGVTGAAVSYLTTLLLLSGMLVLGLSHGFIQAPIITHVASTRTADRLGQGAATSLYRLFERVGNIGGPLIVGAMMIATLYEASTIIWIGFGVLVLGLLYIIIPSGKKHRPAEGSD